MNRFKKNYIEYELNKFKDNNEKYSLMCLAEHFYQMGWDARESHEWSLAKPFELPMDGNIIFNPHTYSMDKQARNFTNSYELRGMQEPTQLDKDIEQLNKDIKEWNKRVEDLKDRIDKRIEELH